MQLENLSNTNTETSTSLEGSWPSNDLHIQTGYEIPAGFLGLAAIIGIIYIGKGIKGALFGLKNYCES